MSILCFVLAVDLLSAALVAWMIRRAPTIPNTPGDTDGHN